jgi:hypothetical protein
MVMAYAIFMEEEKDIVENLDVIGSFKTSLSALLMALNKKGVDLLDVTSEQLRMAFANFMVEVVDYAPSFDAQMP